MKNDTSNCLLRDLRRDLRRLLAAILLLGTLAACALEDPAGVPPGGPPDGPPAEQPADPLEPGTPEDDPPEDEPPADDDTAESDPADPSGDPGDEAPAEPEALGHPALECGAPHAASAARPLALPLHGPGDAWHAAAFVPGELLVQYALPPQHALAGGTPGVGAHANRARAAEVRAAHRLALVRPGVGRAPDRVRVPPGVDPRTALEALRRDPRVLYAEPNLLVEPLRTPNDPLLGEQWNLLAFGAREAWRIETGSSTIVLAIVDAGVDPRHPEFRGRLLDGWDFHDGDDDTSPGSTVHHGTHVAGIAAANGDDLQGVAGVAYGGVRILPVKVFGSDAGGTSTLAMIADAIRWAAGLDVPNAPRNPNPAHVINLSLGTPFPSATLDAAVADACAAGALVVAASGNGSSAQRVMSPASAPHALAVGSVDLLAGGGLERSAFSNYALEGRTVDLMAPGGGGPNACASVLAPTHTDSLGRGRYGCMSGTSMAAPFVAGAAALVWSQNPDWTAGDVARRLLETAFRHDGWNDREYGRGVTCLDAALEAGSVCGRAR